MGDFYETFDSDAEICASVLGIALTSRPMGKEEGRIPLAGIPYRSLERHLERLLSAGHRVAIGEQIGNSGEGLVDRKVVRVVTPGTVEQGSLSKDGGHNWLVAVTRSNVNYSNDKRWGLAYCDVTTGELECELVEESQLSGAWERLRPAELIVPSKIAPQGPDYEDLDLPTGLMLTIRPEREFSTDTAVRAISERFGVTSLDGYGLEGLESAVGAAGAIIAYLEESWPQALTNMRVPRAVRSEEYLYLDAQTARNLELFDTFRDNSDSLLETIDCTVTAMGRRLLRARLGRPLRVRSRAETRLEQVRAFVAKTAPRIAVREILLKIPDLERLLGRVRAGTAPPHQLLSLGKGLAQLPIVAKHARDAGEAIVPLTALLSGTREISDLIVAAITEDLPEETNDGGTIREGFDSEVDQLRSLATDSRQALANLESTERDRSGIASLKIGYHRVFGYYLEVPKSRAGSVPDEYKPRQTLSSSQRFQTAELAELESRILSARDQLVQAENRVLDSLREHVILAGVSVEQAAQGIARLDVAAAIAEFASQRHYVRPQLVDSGALEIISGRHPVVEQSLPTGSFVPNDCELGVDSDLVILTGPNMGGKSTYLRQNALIVLLAHCGCYVPADKARIPMVDRIFSRVGAQDDIGSGQSTFMVEMLETATILHNATEQSLVVFDEVGRGTSTYDGLAIAQAVIESLHHRPGGTPKTLFATHYQELVGLAQTLPRLENRCLAVTEEGGDVVFLHHIVSGAADRSYGVHVASLAGLPRAVVSRARELLSNLESRSVITNISDLEANESAQSRSDTQLRLLGAPSDAPISQPDQHLITELSDLDPDTLSPFEALQRLYELRRLARERLGMEG